MGLFSVLIGYVIEGAFGRAVKELLYAGAGRPIAAMNNGYVWLTEAPHDPPHDPPHGAP